MKPLDHLRKIAYEGFAYAECRDFWLDVFERYYRSSKNTDMAVATAIDHYDEVFEEYGIDKGVFSVAAVLFCLKHNDISPSVACEAYMDSVDLGSGGYDYLFDEPGLVLLKKDLKTLEKTLDDFFNAHPELIE